MHDKEDIFYAVRACVAMHNMMVATRVNEWNEEDDECWYDTVIPSSESSTNAEETSPRIDEAERAVDEDDEYLRANAAMADINNDLVDLEFKDRLERAQFMPRKLRIVQRRWAQLYDSKAHVRLQDAVKRELYMRNHDDDGSDLANIDPITDL